MTSKKSEEKSVQSIVLDELSNGPEAGRSLLDGNLDVIKNVRVKLEVVLGEAEMTVGELFDLKPEAVVKLNRGVSELVDVLLDGKVVARGDLVVSDDNFGIRITQIDS